MQTDQPHLLLPSLNGRIQNASPHAAPLPGNRESGRTGGHDGKAGEQTEVPDWIGPTGVVAVGQVDADALQQALDLSEISGTANL